MPTWPASLPRRPLLDGFSFVPPKLTISSDNETGPPSVRRRTTAGHATCGVAWIIDSEQLATFRAFYEIELAGGAIPFTWPHPIEDRDVQALFDPEGQPTFSKLATSIWRVEGQLLLLP